MPFKKYLAGDVQKACELAHAFETKLIRGFSFYPPKGSDPRQHLPQAVDQLGQIAEACHRSDLTFGLEVEANLVGSNGHLLAEIYQQVNHPAMVLIFDAANILTQGYSTAEVFEQYVAMKPGLGWMHIKDYRGPRTADAAGDQGRPRRRGRAGALRAGRPGRRRPRGHPPRFPPACCRRLEKKLGRRGIPGVFLDLEPHLKGGGQFGGFSGPDGMGVALRGLLPRAGLRRHRLPPPRLRRREGRPGILRGRPQSLMRNPFRANADGTTTGRAAAPAVQPDVSSGGISRPLPSGRRLDGRDPAGVALRSRLPGLRVSFRLRGCRSLWRLSDGVSELRVSGLRPRGPAGDCRRPGVDRPDRTGLRPAAALAGCGLCASRLETGKCWSNGSSGSREKL